MATVPGRKSGSPVAQNAEALFESKSIAEIRRIEQKTRQEVENKNSELRELIGKSYRDLLALADAISEMKGAASAALTNVDGMCKDFEKIKATPFSQETKQNGYIETVGEVGNAHQSLLFKVASRVKFIVDSPETIWSCLDDSRLKESAERLLSAKLVYRTTKSAGGRKVSEEVLEALASFPLLKHQWPLVESFQTQVVRQSEMRLVSMDLCLTDFVSAVTSLVLTTKLSLIDALNKFFQSRLQYLLALCKEECEKDKDSKMPGKLATVARGIHKSFILAYLIFQKAKSHEKGLLLDAISQIENEGVTSLKSMPDSGEEVAAWKAEIGALVGGLSSCGAEQFQQLCQNWLEKYTKDLLDPCSSLLASVTTIEGLAEVEASLRTCCEGNMEELKVYLDLEIFSELEVEDDGDHKFSWDSISINIFAKAVTVWDLMFETMFSKHTSSLLTQAVERISPLSAVEAGLDKFARAIEERNSRAALMDVSNELTHGQRKSSSWQIRNTSDELWYDEWKSEEIGLQLKIKPELSSTKRSTLTGCSGSFVEAIVEQFDDQVKSLLHSTLALIDISKTSSKKHREEIEEVLQTAVDTSMRDLISILKKKLPTDSSETNQVEIEQALLIARFFLSIRTKAKSLLLLLSSPQQWEVERKDKAVRNHGKSGSEQVVNYDTTRVIDLRKALWDTAISAFRVWIAHVAINLGDDLEDAIAREEALFSQNIPRGWEEVMLRQGGEGDGSAGGDDESMEMKINLPAQASPYVHEFLFAASRESNRVGSHMLEVPIIRLLAHALLSRFLAAMRFFRSDPSARALMGSQITALRRKAPSLTEKGTIQLMFDIRFVTDVLSGAYEKPQEPSLPQSQSSKHSRASSRHSFASSASIKSFLQFSLYNPPPDGSHSSTSSKPPRNPLLTELNPLMDCLQEKLDPIDWATYEPILLGNVQKAYNRSAVLYGIFVSLHRLHGTTSSQGKDAASKAVAAKSSNSVSHSETNILNFPPQSIPRFMILPVSGPTVMAVRSASSLSASSPKIQFSGESDETFSFTDLPSRDGDAKGGSTDAGSSFQSFMGQMGSRLGMKGTNFGDVAGLFSTFSYSK